MNKEDCVIGQRVRIHAKAHPVYQKYVGLTGVIKELPLGFVVLEVDIPVLTSDIEPVEEVKRDPPD